MKLSALKEGLEEQLISAEKNQCSYQELLYSLFKTEVDAKKERARNRRLKQSHLEPEKSIENFDFSLQDAVSEKQINQLLDFEWIEQAYNILFLGPPGIGKSHLANAIGLKAVNAGYKVRFISMVELVQLLKTQEIIEKSEKELKKLKKMDLAIIDELGYLPVEKPQADRFFQLVNDFYEQTSVVITSNKSFGKWTEVLGDQVITTAILDRLMHYSEIFNLTGKSYRLEHRKSII